MNGEEVEISKAAYALWQERGCENGSADTDWRVAERQSSGEQVNHEGIITESEAETVQSSTAGDAVEPVEAGDLSRAK